MNEIQTVTKNMKLQQWSDIIQACKASGQRVDDYCAAHDISRNAYYYWLRKVREAALEQPRCIFAEVNQPDSAVSPSCTEPSPVSICLGDAVIHVSEGASRHLLQMAIEAVRNA